MFSRDSLSTVVAGDAGWSTVFVVAFIYAGIDEAGYGPMLGPLCVASTAFMLDAPEPLNPPDLWSILSGGVCRRSRDRRRRIAVDDSKKLKAPNKGPKHPLRHLERGVIAFAHAAGLPADCDTELLEALGATVPREPWYDTPSDLPVAWTGDEVRVAAGPLRRALAATGVTVTRLACEAIPASEFNRQVQSMGNKAAVNICAVMRHVDAIWRQWPHARPRIMIDRQSGRTHYLRTLQMCFPDARIRILAERDNASRYVLERDGSWLSLTFMPEAERQHLPVALASMTAKYVRELFMLRFNRFFSRAVPELRPTAGYVTDARRFLSDVQPVIERLRLTPSRLIRSV